MFMYFFPCNLFIASHKANISAQCGFAKGKLCHCFGTTGLKPTYSGDKQLCDGGIEFTGQYRQNQLVVFVADCGCSELSGGKASVAKHKTTSIRSIIIITPTMLEFRRNFLVSPSALQLINIHARLMQSCKLTRRQDFLTLFESESLQYNSREKVASNGRGES